MPVSQYPTKPNAGFPLEPAGPQHLILQDIPPVFAGSSIKEMKDGGGTYSIATPNYILQWEFLYGGQEPAQIAPLDAHWLEAHGIADGFNFRHPRTNVLYTDVHYQVFEYPQHDKLKAQARRIVLIKRPVG